MKNLSIPNMIIGILSIILMVFLLFCNISFYKNYQKTKILTEETINIVKDDVSNLKNKLSSVDENSNLLTEYVSSQILFVNKKIDSLTEYVSNETKERKLLAKAIEEKENKPNVIVPVENKKDVNEDKIELEKREEIDKKIMESINSLAKRIDLVEETTKVDKEKLNLAVEDLRKKIKITIDHSQKTREKLEEGMKEVKSEINKSKENIDRLDKENRIMNYNYDTVLDIQLKETK